MKKLITMAMLAVLTGGFYAASAQTELTFYTTKGNFKVLLTDVKTPRTVDSFLARVAVKFYDGLIFHRVIDAFMIQGGDPLGTGYGGPGYTTPDEFDTSLKNVPGAIAMANSGPNTNGSQFYVNLVNNAHLNGGYTVFGMTTSGFTVVQTIGHVPVNSTNNRPITDVKMDSVRVTRPPTVVNVVGTGFEAVTIAPNPSNGFFVINLPDVSSAISVVNMTGQIVYSTTAKGLLNVDLHKQPVGLYIVRGSNDKGSFEHRVLVQY